MRIILFSGGVESTAMLEMMDEDDILLTYKDKYFIGHSNIDGVPENLKAIADYYKKKVHYFELHFSKNNIIHAHNTTHLIPIAGMLVHRYPQIKEVWFGLSKDDMYKMTYKELGTYALGWYHDEVFLHFWNEVFPNVPLYSPVKDLTKVQLWEMIPDEIKKYTVSCELLEGSLADGGGCGDCWKCHEQKYWIQKKLKMSDEDKSKHHKITFPTKYGIPHRGYGY